MLSPIEYAYCFEFYNMLRELRSYLAATSQVGCMLYRCPLHVVEVDVVGLLSS